MFYWVAKNSKYPADKINGDLTKPIPQSSNDGSSDEDDNLVRSEEKKRMAFIIPVK